MNQMSKTIAQIGLILTIVGAAMFVVDIGASETWNVIADNPTKSTTDEVFGHCATDPNSGIVTCDGADIIDRLVVTSMTLGLLVGFGVVGVNRNNPQVVNNAIRYLPLLGLVIGGTQFSSEVMDIASGDHVYAASSDAYNGMLLVITGWVATGATKLIKK